MVTALIVAAGKGKRFGAGYNKQYYKINNKEIIARTLDVFEEANFIDDIVVVVSEDEVDYFRENIIDRYGYKKVSKIVKGGQERQHSVYKGLLECSGADIVVIHDGARPFIKKEHIFETIEKAKKFGSAAVAVKVKDTIKIAKDGYFDSTPDRNILYAVQTPQTFRYNLILSAHQYAMEKNILSTDDTSLVELMGEKVRIVEGSYDNIKITTPEDAVFAELILKK
ncbi:MAG: 2-C-methyl-D-erythritol 4-phosphate cytidylyltransferase [Clostridiales bacterium]|nr:2-C-methyl-D-erythritol 4-phosphate cytidylyltransferase [Clostridiales bacterium]